MQKKPVFTQFSEADMKNFEPTMKIGLLATVSPQGSPHITLLSSLMAAAPIQMVWGQFTEGMVYDFVRTNPKTGFLIMNLDKEVWRGKATYTHALRSGKDYDFYNNTPMFRYNAYFGVHTAHYLDLVEYSSKESLPMGSIVLASIATLLAAKLTCRKAEAVLNTWTRCLMDKIGNLKFLAYLDKDGFPCIIPIIQAMSADSETILFSSGVYRDDLRAIPQGAEVAIFGMSLDMTDVLMRGRFEGIRGHAGVRCGNVRVHWVYNSMPPNPGVIYPKVKVTPVREFGE